MKIKTVVLIISALISFASISYADRYSQDQIQSRVLELTDQVENGNGAQRLFAVRQLISIDDRRAVDGLLIALNDEDAFVREKAAEGLEYYHHYSAVRPLCIRLEMENDYYVQVAIIRALGECGNNDIVIFLRDYLLATDDFFLQEEIVDAFIMLGIPEEVVRDWIADN